MRMAPRKIYLKEFDETIYKCQKCDIEVDEHGDCFEFADPCYYCPSHCPSCGRGFCDQSC